MDQVPIDTLIHVLSDDTAAAIEQYANDPPEDTRTQMRIHLLAKELRDLAKWLVSETEKLLAADRKQGARIEIDGSVLRIQHGTSYTGMRKDDLQSDIRASLLVDEDGNDRTGEEVLDELWADESGLQPLGKSLRTAQLRERYEVDLDQYGTSKRTSTVQVIKKGKL
jgi:hypothetical protein